MMMKTRWPKQAGYMLPGILCAMLIWHAGAGVAKGACNAGNILYSTLTIELSKDVVCVGGTVTATVTTDPIGATVTVTSVSSKISITPTVGLPTPAVFTITGGTESDAPKDVPLVATIISGVETDPDEVSCIETSSITVLKVDLDEATFQGTGEHDLKTDDGTYANNGTGDVRVPQIEAGASPKETQICYTWESSPEISANFNVSPSLTTPVAAKIRIEGVQNGQTGTLVYEKDVSLSGSLLTETFTTTDKLKKVVDNTTYDLTWKLSLDGGATYSTIDTTANSLYVTAGTPAASAGALTVTRIAGLTEAADDDVAMVDILDDLHEEYLESATVASVPLPCPLWKAIDDDAGQCEDWVDLLRDCLVPMLTGSTWGTKYFTYARTDGSAHEDTDRNANETRDCGTGDNGHTASHNHDADNPLEKIVFIAGSTKNNWEATLKVGLTYYYSPKMARKASAKEVLEGVPVNHLEWWYLDATGGCNGHCADPGPATISWP